MGLGDDLAVRLPRHTQDAELLLKEHTLLPALAPRLPLQIPVPQRLGQPSERFPSHWIVTTWVGGDPADRAPATRGAEAADTLAAFLAALHQPAPDHAPAGQDGQGGPLAGTGEGFAHSLKEATERGLVSDPDAVREVWDDALAAPDWTGSALWLHADLHPANLLTADGNFCGVVDFGDMCAGDPACDLAACWILLPDGFTGRFHQSYSPAADAATLRRARGWALRQALANLLIAEGGGPVFASWGPPARAALRRLTATARA